MPRGVYDHKPRSQETIEKMRKARVGKPRSKECIRKRTETRKRNAEERGYYHSEEKNKKQSEFMKGDNNPAKRPEVRKKISDSKKGKPRPDMIGENHSNWRGGISEEGYPFNFNDELKEFIRKRDRVCQLCGKTKEENGRRLDVHHIDYIKENLDPSNLITLCRGCHVKVNYKRKFWADFFRGNRKLVQIESKL